MFVKRFTPAECAFILCGRRTQPHGLNSCRVYIWISLGMLSFYMFWLFYFISAWKGEVGGGKVCVGDMFTIILLPRIIQRLTTSVQVYQPVTLSISFCVIRPSPFYLVGIVPRNCLLEADDCVAQILYRMRSGQTQVSFSNLLKCKVFSASFTAIKRYILVCTWSRTWWSFRTWEGPRHVGGQLPWAHSETTIVWQSFSFSKYLLSQSCQQIRKQKKNSQVI